jgi:hypothetical protein
MIIDLKRKVIKTQLRRFITLLIFIVLILLVLLILDYNKKYFGLTRYALAIIVAGVYVVFVLYQAVLEPNYIYFSDERDRIILRYFSMSFYNDKKQSIEIPREAFSGYEVKKSFGGLKEKLVLLERVNNKDARYPPVSITALTKNQRNNLLAALDRNIIVFD